MVRPKQIGAGQTTPFRARRDGQGSPRTPPIERVTAPAGLLAELRLSPYRACKAQTRKSVGLGAGIVELRAAMSARLSFMINEHRYALEQAIPGRLSLALFSIMVFRLLLTWGPACLLNAVRAIMLGQIRPRG